MMDDVLRLRGTIDNEVGGGCHRVTDTPSGYCHRAESRSGCPFSECIGLNKVGSC